jgi:hypothetical protein
LPSFDEAHQFLELPVDLQHFAAGDVRHRDGLDAAPLQLHQNDRVLHGLARQAIRLKDRQDVKRAVPGGPDGPLVEVLS